MSTLSNRSATPQLLIEWNRPREPRSRSKWGGRSSDISIVRTQGRAGMREPPRVFHAARAVHPRRD